MADPDKQRERDRFADNTDKWGPWAAAIGILIFLLVPVWNLLSWLIGLF